MEYRTKEMKIIYRADNIIETQFNEGITELTVEGAEENIKLFGELDAIDDKPKGALTTMPSFYIKKNVVKKYTTTEVLIPVAMGIITTSFSSKLMGNLFLTLRDRFWSSTDDYPVRIFDNREDAIKWIRGHLEKAEKEATQK